MSNKPMAPRLPHVGFVREALVRKLFPVSRTVLWKLVRDGHFPSPTKLGPRTTAWPVQVLREHFASISPLAVETVEVLS
jgi:predicted DNA-binding transcriptional regulator AlpA